MLVRTVRPVVGRTADSSFDQLVNAFFDARRPTSPMVDASWDGDEYAIVVDLPGVPASDVSVDVVGDQLIVSAVSNGSEWKRTARLGSQLDSNKISARHVDGRLTIRVGKVDTPEPRSIKIDVTPIIAVESSAKSSAEVATAGADTAVEPAVKPAAKKARKASSKTA